MNQKKTILISIAIVMVSIAGIFALVTSFQKNNNLEVKSAQIEIPDVRKQKELATLSESEWQKRLTQNQFAVLRKAGTEVPYSSLLLDEKRKGTYVTADCGEPVFRSEQKFETGTGWPSFWAPIDKNAVLEKLDTSEGQERIEIISPICKSHLGHVFNDAPKTPTGLRYCINGLALIFIPDTVQ